MKQSLPEKMSASALIALCHNTFFLLSKHPLIASCRWVRYGSHNAQSATACHL